MSSGCSSSALSNQPRPPGTTKRKFSPEEDSLLSAIVAQLGDSNWKQVAAFMGDRNFRQCRERWKNYLAPNVSKGPWTAEEDHLLKAKYEEIGSQWSVIARFFPTRTDVSLKNRWVALTSHSGTERRVRRKKGASKEKVTETVMDDWSDACISRFCEEAEIYDGDESPLFGF
jgi:hypothetical protein